jgi:hypothetical protein
VLPSPAKFILILYTALDFQPENMTDRVSNGKFKVKNVKLKM